MKKYNKLNILSAISVTFCLLIVIILEVVKFQPLIDLINKNSMTSFIIVFINTIIIIMTWISNIILFVRSFVVKEPKYCKLYLISLYLSSQFAYAIYILIPEKFMWISVIYLPLWFIYNIYMYKNLILKNENNSK